MKKEKVAVMLTQENYKEVLLILELFGEEIVPFTLSKLLKDKFVHDGHPYLYYNGIAWAGPNWIEAQKVIDHYELAVIILKDHIKKHITNSILYGKSPLVASRETNIDPGLNTQTITKEVWVNIKGSDTSIDLSKSTIELLNSVIGGEIIKATLTYDIPMTKV